MSGDLWGHRVSVHLETKDCAHTASQLGFYVAPSCNAVLRWQGYAADKQSKDQIHFLLVTQAT